MSACGPGGARCGRPMVGLPIIHCPRHAAVDELVAALKAHGDPCGGQGWIEGPPEQVDDQGGLDDWVRTQIECQHCAALKAAGEEA